MKVESPFCEPNLLEVNFGNRGFFFMDRGVQADVFRVRMAYDEIFFKNISPSRLGQLAMTFMPLA